jgi:glyoxylase I family protein
LITGIDHIEIVVKDINEMAEFFTRLGFVELRRTDHHGKAVEMQLPGDNPFVIEFHTGTRTEPPGINHIAFRTTDCAATARELEAQGVPFDSPVKTASSGRVVASFRDPMYMRWQLTD